MASTAPKIPICVIPIRNMPTILPNICVNGDTLVIRISIIRELFSEVTSAAIIFPVIMVVIQNSRIII
ncbi:hypothetical protein D3C85_1347090 [compost metagenome]